MNKIKILQWMACAGVAVGLWIGAAPAVAQEKGNEHPWNMSVSVGRMDFEGDFPTDDGFISTLRLGYDWNTWWTLEAGLMLCPYLEGSTYIDYDNNKGKGAGASIDRLEDEAGVDSTWAAGLTGDALFHFTPWKRVDPYLSLGVAAIRFGDSFDNNDDTDAALRAGGGVIYNFNDEWSVRGDFRAAIAGLSEKGTVNSVIDVGVRYVFGAHVPPAYSVSGGPLDSDADGLTDDEEINTYRTNPNNPDTDEDGLGDFAEVKTWKTDPLNPDTDFDGLKDGPEVYNHKTNPLMQDTDKGGVADGHEVIEDHTNPLDPRDDLILYTLNIQFDYDQSIIKPEFFKDLDLIGKVMHRDPGATARIEGHADKQTKSDKKHNDRLSESRAKACVDYLVSKCAVERGRMVPVGYGFSRPKAPNGPDGNPVNRRVEVYIRKSDGGGAKLTDTVQAEPAPVK
jgi:outer membrane protein OmpA-like peptidoglycan-associated protein/opacity protein-like surface antigen